MCMWQRQWQRAVADSRGREQPAIVVHLQVSIVVWEDCMGGVYGRIDAACVCGYAPSRVLATAPVAGTCPSWLGTALGPLGLCSSPLVPIGSWG